MDFKAALDQLRVQAEISDDKYFAEQVLDFIETQLPAHIDANDTDELVISLRKHNTAIAKDYTKAVKEVDRLNRELRECEEELEETHAMTRLEVKQRRHFELKYNWEKKLSNARLELNKKLIAENKRLKRLEEDYQTLLEMYQAESTYHD